MTDDFWRMWRDQLAFNYTLRGDPPSDFETRSAQTKDMVLYLMSELDELLRTTVWKGHRKQAVLANRAHTLEECVDIFKLWMSIAQIWGFTPDEIVEAYDRKSAVCVQRHMEEFVRQATNLVVVDIDNVLADYIKGMVAFLRPQLGMSHIEILDDIEKNHKWINANSLQISNEGWQALKHQFRVTGQKRLLPVMPEAKSFLTWLKNEGYTVALLTSRPIDKYPTIYTDTVEWLQKNQLPFDFVWWAHDKAERLIEADVRKEVRFVVDDDIRFVDQMAKLGLRTFWVQWSVEDHKPHESEYVTPVNSLFEICWKIHEEGWSTEHGV